MFKEFFGKYGSLVNASVWNFGCENMNNFYKQAPDFASAASLQPLGRVDAKNDAVNLPISVRNAFIWPLVLSYTVVSICFHRCLYLLILSFVLNDGMICI